MTSKDALDKSLEATEVSKDVSGNPLIKQPKKIHHEKDEHLHLVDPVVKYVRETKYHWLYSARNGYWWHFNQVTNEILENAFIMDENPTLTYNSQYFKIYFERMVQVNLNSKGSRNIKRVDDLSTVKLRGVAGKYYNQELFID